MFNKLKSTRTVHFKTKHNIAISCSNTSRSTVIRVYYFSVISHFPYAVSHLSITGTITYAHRAHSQKRKDFLETDYKTADYLCNIGGDKGILFIVTNCTFVTQGVGLHDLSNSWNITWNITSCLVFGTCYTDSLNYLLSFKFLNCFNIIQSISIYLSSLYLSIYLPIFIEFYTKYDIIVKNATAFFTESKGFCN